MSFLRNAEVKRQIMLYLLLTVLSAVIGFFISPLCGMGFAAVGILYSLIGLISTCTRYRRIAALSREIDLILHGKEEIHLSDYAEGELAILQSEISKMTIQLREQAEQLMQDKVYLADSIADISHQIRTPLTSINLIVSFLSEPDLSEKRRSELIMELKKLLGRIDWLITTLLKMSKLDAGTAQLKHERVAVKTLLQKAAEPLAIPMDLRDQTLCIRINGEESYLGDFAWSVEAVGNILKNCMEHTPAGGKLTVSVTENALFTQIIIHDTGSGIAKEDLPYIFERFYKGKDSSDTSFGIGLALARMIITSQHGTIKAENHADGGACFTIRFYKGTV